MRRVAWPETPVNHVRSARKTKALNNKQSRSLCMSGSTRRQPFAVDGLNQKVVASEFRSVVTSKPVPCLFHDGVVQHAGRAIRGLRGWN
jgi:hypothetical protein